MLKAHLHPGRSASGFLGASVLSGSQQNKSEKYQIVRKKR